MTSLKDPKPTAIAPLRRPTESPRFWVLLGVGSIALHGLLLLGMRWMNFRASIATSNADSLPVELIEIAPDAAPTIGSSTVPPVESIAPPAEEAAPPPPSEPAAPEFAPPEAIAPPAELDTEQLPPPTPTPDPPIAPPVAPPIAPPTQPATDPPAQPSAQPPIAPPAAPSTQTPSDPNAQPSTQPPIQPSTPSPVSGLDGSNSGSASEGQPDQGIPSDSGTGGIITEGLPPVPVYEPPAGFVASLSVSPPSIDIPQETAQPIESSRAIVNDGSQSSCTATPNVLGYWGTPVEFRVRVDRDPDDPTIGTVAADGLTQLQPSGSTDYDDLAACLVREWAFRPPDTDAVVEAPSSEVIVTVQIDPG